MEALQLGHEGRLLVLRPGVVAVKEGVLLHGLGGALRHPGRDVALRLHLRPRRRIRGGVVVLVLLVFVFFVVVIIPLVAVVAHGVLAVHLHPHARGPVVAPGVGRRGLPVLPRIGALRPIRGVRALAVAVRFGGRRGVLELVSHGRQVILLLLRGPRPVAVGVLGGEREVAVGVAAVAHRGDGEARVANGRLLFSRFAPRGEGAEREKREEAGEGRGGEVATATEKDGSPRLAMDGSRRQGEIPLAHPWAAWAERTWGSALLTRLRSDPTRQYFLFWLRPSNISILCFSYGFFFYFDALCFLIFFTKKDWH